MSNTLLLASTDPKKVQYPMYQVELFIAWDDKTWDCEQFVYVSSQIEKTEIEELAKHTWVEEYEKDTSSENVVVFVGIYHFSEDVLYDSDGEEWQEGVRGEAPQPILELYENDDYVEG